MNPLLVRFRVLSICVLVSLLLSSIPPLSLPSAQAQSQVAAAPAISGPVAPAVVEPPAPAVPVESPAVPHPEPPPPSLPAQVTPPVRPDTLQRLPLAFVPNQGQAPDGVRFQLRAFGGTSFLTDDALVLTLPAPRLPDPPREPLPRPDTPAPNVPYRALRIAFVDASATTPRATSRLPGSTSAILGNDPKAWQRAMPSYAGVLYPALYPGIDLHYTGDDGQLKRAYTLAPGADPARIRWAYTGAADVRLGESGQLSVTLPLAQQPPSAQATAVLTPATLVEHPPIAWQDIGGRRLPVEVRFAIDQQQQVGFALGAYDRSLPLTIDPTITYSTFLGGSNIDVACGVAVDADDAIYVTGYTHSTNFPTTTGAFTTTLAGNADVFVTKFDTAGDLVYSTYLGGSSTEYNLNACTGIAVNQDGEVYLAGVTVSTNFPTVNAYDSSHNDATDAFVAVLSAAGDDLLYSTYMGNPADNYADAIAVDAAGIAYVGGSTCCDGGVPFPTRNPYQGTYGGYYSDGFIAKIDPSASGDSSLLYSTFLGGSGDDFIHALALDAQNNIYVAGKTDSPGFGSLKFPVSLGAAQDTLAGQVDAFVFKLNNAGTARRYGTYLGGNYNDKGFGLAVDSLGQATVVGTTDSTVFQPTPNATQKTLAGSTDLFVAQLNASGTAWRLRTYLGGSGQDEANAVIATRTGRLVVTGDTRSLDFPNAEDLPNYPSNSYGDAVLASFDSASGQLLWSSQFGGSGREIGYALATRRDGAVVVVGETTSTSVDFPLQNAAQATSGGGSDAFVTVIARGALPPDQERTQGCQCDAQYDWPFPVNTRTGNYWTRATDLAVQTPGVPLAWSRTYASQSVDETIGALGYGWQHPYATRVITPGAPSGEDGTIIVLSPENNRLRYAALGNGLYAAWPGVYGSLASGNGVYTQTLRSQGQYVFDASTGLLQDVYDAQGRRIRLDYNGSGLLAAIVDDANVGRTLTLTYTGDLITRVGDGQREIAYSYDAGTDDLTRVQDLRSQTTIYTYTNHLLTAIRNPIHQIERIGYDGTTAASKVMTQTLIDGSEIDFAYFSTHTTITTTGVDGLPQVERIDYASDESMTGRSINHQAILGTAYDESFSPGVVIDGNEHATQTAYNTDGLPLEQINALGQTSQANYDGQNNLLSTIDTQGVTTLFRYDSFSNLISTTTGITTTSSISATTLYQYQYQHGGTWNITEAGASDSRLFTQTGPDGAVTRYEYTNTLYPHQVTRTIAGYQNGAFDSHFPDQDVITAYRYDPVGRVISTTVALGSPVMRTDLTEYNLDNSVKRTIQNYKSPGAFSAARPDENIIARYGYDRIGRMVAVTDTLGLVSLTHYDNAGRVDWAMRNAVGAQYDAFGQPLFKPYSRLVPDANVTTIYGYDGLGRTSFVTETGILTGTFNISTLQFSDVTTRTTRTQYDGLSRPVTVTLNYHANPLSTADRNIKLYTRYDGASNVITQTDALGRWTVTQYDMLNRPVKTITNYQNGNPESGPADSDIISVTQYDTAGRVSRTIDNYVNGLFTATQLITDQITLFQYDHFSRNITTTLNYDPPTLVSRTDTNRVSVSRYHPTTMRLQGQRDPLDRWVSQQYDLLGRTVTTTQNCTGVTAPASCGSQTADTNGATRTLYDALGHTTLITDALSTVTRSFYDGLGRSTKTIQNYVAPGTSTTAITNVTTLTKYDGLGRTLIMTDALGYPTYQSYNGLGQTTFVTDTLGRVTRMGYDGQGTLRWSKAPTGQVTVYQLDALGRVVTTIANYQDGVADANTSQDLISRTVYDAAGRRLRQVQHTMPAYALTTVFAYNNLDQLITVTENQVTSTCTWQPCNVQTQYRYDRLGNRTAIVDARGNTRIFTFDAASQQTSADDPVHPPTAWTYDRGGRVTTQDDPRGSEYDLSFSYDNLDRRLQTAANNPAVAQLAPINASYNALGQRTDLDDGAGSTDFQFDRLGRMIRATITPSGQSAQPVGYSYNARGERTQISYPNSGPTVQYSYWPDGQLKDVIDSTTLISYTYDLQGRLRQVARANRQVTHYGYDSAERLIDSTTSVSDTVVGRFEYDYNHLGLRTTVTETLQLTPTLSSTWMETGSFEAASLTDPVSGVDQVVGMVELETAAPIKGAFSARVPNTNTSYLREDIADTNSLFRLFRTSRDGAHI